MYFIDTWDYENLRIKIDDIDFLHIDKSEFGVNTEFLCGNPE